MGSRVFHDEAYGLYHVNSNSNYVDKTQLSIEQTAWAVVAKRQALATSWPQGDTDGVCELLDAGLQGCPGFLVKGDVFGLRTHYEAL